MILVLLRRLTAAYVSLSRWVKVIGITTLVAVVGSGIKASGFVYDAVIEPRTRPIHLEVSAELKEASRRDGYAAVEARLAVSNKSSQTAYILASYVTGWGVTASMRPDATDDEFAKRGLGLFAYTRTDRGWQGGASTRASRYAADDEPPPEVVFAGRNLGDGWVFYPDEEYATTLVLLVPPARFDSVVAEFTFVATKDPEVACARWVADPEALSPHLEARAGPERIRADVAARGLARYDGLPARVGGPLLLEGPTRAAEARPMVRRPRRLFARSGRARLGVSLMEGEP